MFSNAEEIRRCLEALGSRIEADGLPEISILICGGSALSLSGLISRATADVDSLGAMAAGLRLQPLPGWILGVAAHLSRELGVDDNWLNDAAAALGSVGLPDGILSRAKPEAFGSRLRVLIASRKDLVALKCFAAMDPKSGGKHLGDLVDLAPTPEELGFTASWLLNRPTSPQFRKALRNLFSVLGWELPHEEGDRGSEGPSG